MTSILIATRNVHKVREIKAVLGPAFVCFSLTDFPNAPTPVEDADSFSRNATKKAVELAAWLSAHDRQWLETVRCHKDTKPAGFVIADDSGLEVDALNGAPGVHSARFAASGQDESENASDQANNMKLLRLLENVAPDNRTARFRCVIALAPFFIPTGSEISPKQPETNLPRQTILFEGACEGHIIAHTRGKSGFGYDPVFVPIGYSETFAELGDKIKNQISHRAIALAKLKSALQTL